MVGDKPRATDEEPPDEQAGSRSHHARPDDRPPTPSQLRATAPAGTSRARQTDFSDQAGQAMPLPGSAPEKKRSPAVMIGLAILTVTFAAFFIPALLSAPTAPAENPTEQAPPDFVKEESGTGQA